MEGSGNLLIAGNKIIVTVITYRLHLYYLAAAIHLQRSLYWTVSVAAGVFHLGRVFILFHTMWLYTMTNSPSPRPFVVGAAMRMHFKFGISLYPVTGHFATVSLQQYQTAKPS